jgi:hypothetical protein
MHLAYEVSRRLRRQRLDDRANEGAIEALIDVGDAGDRFEAALVGGVVVTQGANCVERARYDLGDVFPPLDQREELSRRRRGCTSCDRR